MQQSYSSAEVQAAGGLDKWSRKVVSTPPPGPGPRPVPPASLVRRPSPLPPARGRLPRDLLVGYDRERMNKTEARYAAHLEMQKQAGAILLWRFESVKFRLATLTWYSPDFYVLLPDGSIEIHEVKGHWEDDARVKIKATAEQFPELCFVAVQWKKGEWQIERFRAGGVRCQIEEQYKAGPHMSC